MAFIEGYVFSRQGCMAFIEGTCSHIRQGCVAFIEGYVFSHQAGVRGLYRGVRVLTSGMQGPVRGLYRGVRVLTSGRGAWPL